MALISLKSVVRMLVYARIMLQLTRFANSPLQYKRITLNKISFAFFLFSVIQGFAQVTILFLLYSVDTDNSNLVASVIHEADIPPREIAWLTGNSKLFKLHLCTNIPLGITDKTCTTAFDFRQGNESIPIPPGFRRSVRDLTYMHLPPRSFFRTGRGCCKVFQSEQRC